MSGLRAGRPSPGVIYIALPLYFSFLRTFWSASQFPCTHNKQLSCGTTDVIANEVKQSSYITQLPLVLVNSKNKRS